MKPVTLQLGFPEEVRPPLQPQIHEVFVTSIGLCLDLRVADKIIRSANV